MLRAAYELGRRIPGDLSLVGYDNAIIASIGPINVTSVDQAGHDMGATAARLLCKLMVGRSRSVLTSAAPRLIIRNTHRPSGPLADEIPGTSRGLRPDDQLRYSEWQRSFLIR